MKTKILLMLLLGLPAFFTINAYDVPTTVEKKKILLEEYTGIHCGFCPQGHIIANNLLAVQPENIYVIAIHAGNYARPGSDEPDFRIDAGEALDREFEVDVIYGYPSGMINRHDFDGANVLSRSAWAKKGKEIHTEDAPVNLLMKSTFDGNTRELAVTIEGYYTKQVEETVNFLNIAIVQSNIQGPQNGGGVGSDYIHKHMLRAFITPEWGERIENPKAGEYFTREYTYTLPNDIKGVELKAENIEVIAFVCADKTDVLNVTGGKPEYKNYDKPLAGTLLKPAWEITGRYAFEFFPVQFSNESSQAVTKLGFEITLNGEKQSSEWTDSIPAFHTLPIDVDINLQSLAGTNNYEIKLISINGTSFEGNTLKGSFNGAAEITPKISLEIQTDHYADENIFSIKDQKGNIIKEFGPYEVGKKAIYKETVELEADKVYCFEVMDKWADGVESPQGAKGYYKLYDESGKMIAQQYTLKTFGDRTFFKTFIPSSIYEQEYNHKSSVYTDAKHVEVSLVPTASGKASIAIYSATGKLCAIRNMHIISGEKHIENISMASFPSGIYLLKITQEGYNETFKVILH